MSVSAATSGEEKQVTADSTLRINGAAAIYESLCDSYVMNMHRLIAGCLNATLN